MQVESTTHQGYQGPLGPAASTNKTANGDAAAASSAGADVPSGTNAPTSSVAQVASRYNLNSISPREIDQMAAELHAGGHIPDAEYLAMLTQGAEFLSHLPGNYDTDAKLDEPGDLIGDIKDQITEARNHGAPTENGEKLLAMFETLKTLASGGGTPNSGPMADATLSELITMQERERGMPIDEATRIDLESYVIQDVTPEMKKRAFEMTNMIYVRPNIPPSTDYATVRVDGKVVATIYNSGGVATSNAMHGQMQEIFKNETLEGPQLAKQRAQKLARALGGSIDRASTAQTQQQWNNRPSVTWSIDLDAMARHGREIPESLLNKRYASNHEAKDALMAAFKHQWYDA